MNRWPKYQKIEAHLRDKYKNIFTEKAIRTHLEEYISDAHTNHLIEKILPPITNKNKLLDIGSGYGEFVRKANQNGFDAYGIEIAVFEHTISQEMAKNNSVSFEKFILGSALSLPYENASFDIITFWNVLEHVHDFQKALKEAIRVLKPGGKMYILAPNYCAFRREAHYHVPWVPFFPKKLAGVYLKILGRDPCFLYDNIFYISSRQLYKFLRKQGLTVTTDANEKIKMNHPFNSLFKRVIFSAVKKYRLVNIFNFVVFFLKTHPFTYSIDIIARNE